MCFLQDNPSLIYCEDGTLCIAEVFIPASLCQSLVENGSKLHFMLGHLGQSAKLPNNMSELFSISRPCKARAALQTLL